MKIINHIRRWNIWRKHCTNGKLHKLLVLFGIIKSPTLATTFLPEDVEAIIDGFRDGVSYGEKMKQYLRSDGLLDIEGMESEEHGKSIKNQI